jgi:Lar family restriction alleviation protein
MSNTLLPCPFCGGEALMRERYINGIANTKHYRRECRHCKATFAHWYRSMKKADEAWNRRVQPELIRCEKCDYWDKSASYMSAHACAFWSSGKKTRYTENHEFCSFAERKEE